jgi:hypothetical protein
VGCPIYPPKADVRSPTRGTLRPKVGIHIWGLIWRNANGPLFDYLGRVEQVQLTNQ